MSGPQPIVRALDHSDLDEAVAMFLAVADEDRWIGTEPGEDVAERTQRWQQQLESPAHRSLVAVVDGTIVGNVGVALAPDGVAELGMAVAAGWRGRGVGGRLLDVAIDSACEDFGAHKLALQLWPHNARALALYRSRGFTVEGRLVRHYRRRNGELWDALIMGLVLDHHTPDSPHGDDSLWS